MYIHTLLIGEPKSMTDARGTWRSAIFRAPVSEALYLDTHGLAGDQVADTRNHGSLDQAVSCYPLRHYAEWNAEYALEASPLMLGPGSVGENWTLTDILEADVCIGDIYRVGDARVQVSQPRYPCIKQERKVRLPGFLQRVMQTMRTGFYLRVLTAGSVQVNSELVLETRPHPDLSVQRLNMDVHLEHDPIFAARLLDVPELSAGWKRIVRIMREREATRVEP